MGIYKAEIANMRKSIGDNAGQKIIIKEPAGKRSKPEEREATIEQTYKDYFMVRFDQVGRVSSYNYTDLFMKSIEMSIFDGNRYIPLEIPDVADRKNKLHKLSPEQVEGKIMGNPAMDLELPSEIA